MIRKYRLSIWKDEEQRWEHVEFDAETNSEEPKNKAIKIYREKKLDNNCFLAVWVPKNDPQFSSRYYDTWLDVIYFPAAFKEHFLKGDAK